MSDKCLFDKPILFLIFNRPETTKLVFEKIRSIKPARFFISCDGPRLYVPTDISDVHETRKVVLQNIDWPCQVKTFLREENWGCKRAISSAMHWFFAHVDEGIILEDDCVPEDDFFPYCAELLEKYRDNPQIMHISGRNFQNGIRRGEASYYFSYYNHIGGFATWQRAWKKYDLSMTTYLNFRKESSKLKTILPRWKDRFYWQFVLKDMNHARLNSWHHAWTYACWKNASLACIPNVNLVRHIDSAQGSSQQAVKMLFPLAHPEKIVVDREADRYTAEHHYKSSFFRTFFARLLKKLGMYKTVKKFLWKWKK